MDDAEKQFYSDPVFELDLSVMRLKAHLEYANEKLEELKAVTQKIIEASESQERDENE